MSLQNLTERNIDYVKRDTKSSNLNVWFRFISVSLNVSWALKKALFVTRSTDHVTKS